MAFLEERKGWFRVIFTFRGKRYAHALGTQEQRVADAVRGSIDRTLLQIRQSLLVIPKALGKNNLNNCSCYLTRLQLLHAMSL